MQKTTVKIPERPNYLFYVYHAFIILSILFILFNVFFKNDKIAYVDSVRILNEYKGSEEAKKQYQSKARVWQANIDTLTSDVKNSIQQYERSMATMPVTEQNLAKQLIQTKQKQLADYQRGIQDNAKQEDGRLMQKVVAQIDGFLSRYGKTQNYKLILIANQSGTIAYAREGLDITNEVVEKLNEEYLSGKK